VKAAVFLYTVVDPSIKGEEEVRKIILRRLGSDGEVHLEGSTIVVDGIPLTIESVSRDENGVAKLKIVPASGNNVSHGMYTKVRASRGVSL